MTTGIKTNDDGTLELDVLSEEDITAYLAQTHSGKGQYKAALSSTVGNGDYYIDFCKHPDFVGKEVGSMYQSVDNNLKKLASTPNFPKCRIVRGENKLLVINLDVHAARVAAKATETK